MRLLGLIVVQSNNSISSPAGCSGQPRAVTPVDSRRRLSDASGFQVLEQDPAGLGKEDHVARRWFSHVARHDLEASRSRRNELAKAMLRAPMSVIDGRNPSPPNSFISRRSRRAPSFECLV